MAAAAAALRIAVYSPRTGRRAYMDAASAIFCPVGYVNFGKDQHDFAVLGRADACHERVRCRECGFETVAKSCTETVRDVIVGLRRCLHCRHLHFDESEEEADAVNSLFN
jgi:hypothetical protein